LFGRKIRWEAAWDSAGVPDVIIDEYASFFYSFIPAPFEIVIPTLDYFRHTDAKNPVPFVSDF
jgi:hypothetical protein